VKADERCLDLYSLLGSGSANETRRSLYDASLNAMGGGLCFVLKIP
jgi:hypothetical protein